MAGTENGTGHFAVIVSRVTPPQRRTIIMRHHPCKTVKTPWRNPWMCLGTPGLLGSLPASRRHPHTNYLPTNRGCYALSCCLHTRKLPRKKYNDVSVAQWIRASVSGTEGRRFESCRGHTCPQGGFTKLFQYFHETSCRPKENGREHKSDPLRSFGGVIFLCLNAVPARVIARIVYEREPSRGRVSVLILWRGFCSAS